MACRLRGIVEVNGEKMLKVDQLLAHQGLPAIKKTDNRHTRGEGRELWLVDKPAVTLPPNSVMESITVWLMDLPQLNQFDYYVQEILYQFDNR